jgi:hypothetical protein
VPSDDLHQRFAGLQERLAPLVDAPAPDAIVRRGRQRRARRAGALLTAAVLVAVGLVIVGRGGWPLVDPGPQPVAPGPLPSLGPTTTVPPTTTTLPPTTTRQEPTTSRAEPTTTLPPVQGQLVLGVRGLGPATFGQPADQVVAALRAVLGRPDEDRRWDQRKQQLFGVCPGSNHRFVRWGKLSVLFADGDTGQGNAGRQHFFAWYAEAPKAAGKRLATPEGVTVGSTTAQVRAAYGDRATLWGAEGGLPAGFRVGSPQDFELFGWLTDPGPRGTVTMLAAGAPCGE